MHIKNFLNYWYGNCSPSNFTALLYTLDVEEKGILHIKSNIVSMICACITLLTSEFGNNFVSMILFRECNVCRLFDVQYSSEWIQVSESIICTMPWCATVCLASRRTRILSLTVRLQRASFWCKRNHFIISILPHWIKLDMSIDTEKFIYLPQRRSWNTASFNILCESSVKV